MKILNKYIWSATRILLILETLFLAIILAYTFMR
jgi:hypothetical protein